MAEDKISDIIDEKAYQQLDLAISKLKQMQDELAKSAKSAIEMSSALSQSGSYKEFAANLEKSAVAQEKLRKSRADASAAEERLAQVKQRTIDQAEKAFKKEAEIEAKRVAQIKRRAEAEKKFASEKISLEGDIENKTIKSVVNQTEAIKALGDAEAVEISLHNEKVRAKEATANATRKSADEDKKARDILDQYSGTLKEQVSNNVNLKTQLQALRIEIKETNSSQFSSIETKKHLAEQEIILKSAIQQSNLELNRSVKEQNAAEGSSDQLSTRLDRLRAAYRGLNKDERDNIEIGGKLLANITDLDKELKKLDASQGVFNRFVGEYGTWGNSLNSIFPVLGDINNSLKTHSTLLTKVSGSVKDYVNGTMGMTEAQKAATMATGGTSAAMKVLRIALISTGIGAIVVVLGSLIAYLASTQEGIDKIRSVTIPLTTIFQKLIGVVQEIGKRLFEAFTNPKQALKDLVDFLQNNVMNRLRAFSVIIDAIKNFDTKGMVNGFAQLGLGITDVTGKIERFGEGVADVFSQAYIDGQKIAQLQIDIENGEINLIKRKAELNKEFKIANEMAKDASLSNKERQAAGQRAIDITEEQLKLEQKQIDMSIQLAKLKAAQNDTDREAEKEIAELEAKRIDFESAASERRTQARMTLNRVNAKIASDDKKASEARIKALEKEELAEAELALQRAKNAQSKAGAVVDDKDNAFEDRLNNLEYFYKKEEEIININFQKQLIGNDIQGTELVKLEEQRTADLEKLLIDRANRLNAVILSNASEEDRALAEAGKRELDQISINTNNQLLALNDRLKQGLITEKQYEEERLRIQEEYTQLYIAAEIRAVEKLIEVNKKRGIDTISQERQLAELKVRLAEKTAEKLIESAKSVEEIEKEIADKRKQLLRDVADLAQQLVIQQFEQKQADLEQELIANDEKEQRAIDQVERTILSEDEKRRRIKTIQDQAAEDRAKIEAKQREEQMKQAKFERTAAIISAGIQTAVAVVKSLAMGPPQGYILAAITAALGAVQVAAIASKPLPKYFKGTNYSQEGFAHVGERGQELMIDPDGSMKLTPDHDTVTYLKKGTTIKTAAETKRILARPDFYDKPNFDIKFSTSKLERLQEKQIAESRLTRKAIAKGSAGTIITKSGIHYIGNSARKMKEFNIKNF